MPSTDDARCSTPGVVAPVDGCHRSSDADRHDDPVRYVTCVAVPGIRADGCGHALADHTDGLRCRICGVECGIAPRARGFAVPSGDEPADRLELFPDG